MHLSHYRRYIPWLEVLLGRKTAFHVPKVWLLWCHSGVCCVTNNSPSMTPAKTPSLATHWNSVPPKVPQHIDNTTEGTQFYS